MVNRNRSGVVFLGPSLETTEAQARFPGVTILPPASLGDLYAAASQGPCVIGLVDGTFEVRPTVWHKEILWAMQRGVHVVGASSMGALRGVELEAFGMEGVGQVFASFRSGELEDDDEVAVAHGDASQGHRAYSVAMVDLRATVRSANLAGIVSDHTAELLERCAKALFYPERSHQSMISATASLAAPGISSQLERYSSWWPDHTAEVKRDDALLLLQRVADIVQQDPGPKHVSYRMHHTDMWDRFLATSSRPSRGDDERELFLAEVRLRGSGEYRALVERALARLLSSVEVRRQGLETNGDGSLLPLLEHLGADPNSVDEWLARHDLDASTVRHFAAREEALGWAMEMWSAAVLDRAQDVARADGSYQGLLARAREKDRFLAARGLEFLTPEDLPMTNQEVRDWYFTDRLGVSAPEDLEQYVQSLGYAHTSEFDLDLTREYLWCSHRGRT